MFEPLSKMYGRGFFSGRFRLEWRAPLFVDAVSLVFTPISVIDVGCAVGEFVKEWLKRGIDAYGLEGSPDAVEFLMFPQEKLIQHDLRTPIKLNGKKFDLVTCIEVAEHLDEEFADMFLDNLTKLSDTILMSAAPPGQKGHYHVNCQPYSYWIDKMDRRGYHLDKPSGDKIRTALYKHTREKYHKIKELHGIAGNLMCFRRYQ